MCSDCDRLENYHNIQVATATRPQRLIATIKQLDNQKSIVSGWMPLCIG